MHNIVIIIRLSVCKVRMVFVFIIVVPIVEVTATHTRILVGDTVTLTCNVTTGDPSYVVYTWTFMNASTNTNMTRPEMTNTLTLTIGNVNEFGNYICEARNDAGTGSGTATIEQGGKIITDQCVCVNVNSLTFCLTTMQFAQ